MLVLITYDVKTDSPSGRKRLNKIAKICSDYGQRVQNSVFECELNNAQLLVVKSKLLAIMSDKEDSLRIYNLGEKYKGRIEHFGAKESYDPNGSLIL